MIKLQNKMLKLTNYKQMKRMLVNRNSNGQRNIN